MREKGPRVSWVGEGVRLPPLNGGEDIRGPSPVSRSSSNSSGNSGSVGDNLDGGRFAARAMEGPGGDWARAGAYGPLCVHRPAGRTSRCLKGPAPGRFPPRTALPALCSPGSAFRRPALRSAPPATRLALEIRTR